ncbi:DnaJ domain-containing protein [Luteolibacter flavescens]|uniref:DnaJ domain-containing protein n=1 Tax=Luteolibacter flavescens TaxID=1859460 RepID=A0ABT3FVQ0_9BACT|nr:DnaJ domain-containing protein [Luteolibacter flavescens]MCW1887399.1 DnaJ domain-containing protein [Luteolibacter flavescens]
MMNPFATLGLEPRLAISEEELRAAFREAGKREHPDAGGSGEDFARVQEAFALLSRPSKRLRAWLAAKEISGDERGSISPGLVDLFGKVGTTLQQADAVTKRREAALSTLAKAMLEPAVQQARESLEAALDEVAAALAAEEAHFAAIEGGHGDPWRTARDLAFLEKWQAELKSRFASLW